MFVACARGACTPSHGCRLYRRHGKPFQPMYEREGACTHPHEGRLCRPQGKLVFFFSLTTCSRSRVRGLYPRPRGSSVPTLGTLLWEKKHRFAACARRACTPSPGCRLYLPRGGNLSAVVQVRGACTPSSERRMYRYRGTLVCFLHLHHKKLSEREAPVPPAVEGRLCRPRGTLFFFCLII